MLVILSTLVVVMSIYVGLKLSGLGLAFASGIGLFILTMVLGMPPGNLPINVALIIISVIGFIAILEECGGLDYMVSIAEKILRKNPKHINFLAPLTTYVMTIMAGTGHTTYSIIPVIVEVAKEQNIRPVRPLSSAVIAAQIGIVASPVSAAIAASIGLFDKFNISLAQILMVTIPSTFFGLFFLSLSIRFLPQDLNKESNFVDAILLKSQQKAQNKTPKDTSKGPLSVLLFLITIITIVMFGLFPSLKFVYSNGKSIDSSLLIVIVMLSGSCIAAILTKTKVANIPNQATFKAGISAAICILGVAWLGDTILSYYKAPLMEMAKDTLLQYPWSFALVLFMLSALLNSQAATIIAIMPLGMSMGISPLVLLASLPAACALAVLPTNPIVIGAATMDYTGSSKLGKYVFDHPFLIPGILGIIFSVIFSYAIAEFVV